jgi:hypothetical protein
MADAILLIAAFGVLAWAFDVFKKTANKLMKSANKK